MKRLLSDWLENEEFMGYAYAYPHKTSYGPLDPPVPLADVWHDEEKENLFLYIHLPFCEMRCGFCNLFTMVQPAEAMIEQTMAAIKRQSEAVFRAVEPTWISQMAFGGGTPSYLSAAELARLFDDLRSTWKLDMDAIPISFEVSPATVDPEKIRMLKAAGIKRVSMGVQSFAETDLKQLGRPQSQRQVEAAIELVRGDEFPVFNLDLIYGSCDQSLRDWDMTISRALSCKPEEIFLYPLYVRDQTGLGKTGRRPSDHRRELYQHAHDRLVGSGYQPLSMRLFRRSDVTYSTQHCCQEDGMIGLGPGARSYTTALHYSANFAVGQPSVRRIVADFNRRDSQQFSFADYGANLSGEEQRRRYVIRSLLQVEGLDRAAFRRRFGSEAEESLPELWQLVPLGMGIRDQTHWRLTDEGISNSDVIGPWLYSAEVTRRMREFVVA